jgi:hypothetical protein
MRMKVALRAGALVWARPLRLVRHLAAVRFHYDDSGGDGAYEAAMRTYRLQVLVLHRAECRVGLVVARDVRVPAASGRADAAVHRDVRPDEVVGRRVRAAPAARLVPQPVEPGRRLLGLRRHVVPEQRVWPGSTSLGDLAPHQTASGNPTATVTVPLLAGTVLTTTFIELRRLDHDRAARDRAHGDDDRPPDAHERHGADHGDEGRDDHGLHRADRRRARVPAQRDIRRRHVLPTVVGHVDRDRVRVPAGRRLRARRPERRGRWADDSVDLLELGVVGCEQPQRRCGAHFDERVRQHPDAVGASCLRWTGYSPNPGHKGTGTYVATYCG